MKLEQLWKESPKTTFRLEQDFATGQAVFNTTWPVASTVVEHQSSIVKIFHQLVTAIYDIKYLLIISYTKLNHQEVDSSPMGIVQIQRMTISQWAR